MSYASDALIDAQKREIEKLKGENTELRYKVHVLEGGNRALNVLYDSVKANNDKLRELARKNWFIVLSERVALRIYGVDPDDGAYITALDTEMSESMAMMQELGIEVEE